MNTILIASMSLTQSSRGATLLIYPISGTLAQCDLFDIPSTSHWTGVAIIVPELRTRNCIATRSKTSNKPMPFSLAG
jgi:hypothetical protein